MVEHTMDVSGWLRKQLEEKLVQQLGVERMSKSQVSRLAKSLDQIVEGLLHPAAQPRTPP